MLKVYELFKYLKYYLISIVILLHKIKYVANKYALCLTIKRISFIQLDLHILRQVNTVQVNLLRYKIQHLHAFYQVQWKRMQSTHLNTKLYKAIVKEAPSSK